MGAAFIRSRGEWFQLLLVCCALASAARSAPAAAKDFDVPLSGHGHIRSFMYFDWGPDNWIDTFIGLESELLRYKRSFLVFRFENETDMGRGADPKMIFDPNRGRWTFGVGARTELQKHFLELLVRHDCHHGIDRWWPGQDYKMTSAGLAFGTLAYLQKYRYPGDVDGGASLPLGLAYFVMPTFYLPRGDPWQRQPYLIRLEANTRIDIFRWSRLGLGLESANVLYWSDKGQLQRSHALNLDMFLYGDHAALLLFAGWWPYDNQVFRNRAGKIVSGLEISF